MKVNSKVFTTYIYMLYNIELYTKEINTGKIDKIIIV